MKVLVTGGAGFIGSNLADRLLDRGDEVLVIDNYATGRRDSLVPRGELRVVEGSVADEQLVMTSFGKFHPEVVVHAAASYKDPKAFGEDSRSNTVGTANVVAASHLVAVRRFVYFQTALCYGVNPREQPITLRHELAPYESSYAITKTAGESLVRISGLDFISFRLANAYGPRNLSGPLPTFFQRLTGGKACFVMDTRRDFVFIDDLIAISLMAIDGRGRSGIYHVSSGRDYAIKDLYAATRGALGLPSDSAVEVRPRGQDDAFTILLDPSETERDFQWSATTGLDDGVRSAGEWDRTHGLAATYTHLKLE